MRAIWSGALSFGLINIPVRLYSASRAQALSFHLLDKKDHCPISYVKVCRDTGEEVPYEKIVKAYEIEKGQFVTLTKEDFERAQAEKTDTIEIVSFADEVEIDTKLFEKPYFVEPDKKAHKAYALLRDALEESGRVAVARFVMKEREHLAIVKTEGNVMMLIQLRFQTEVLTPKGLDLPKKEKMYTQKEFKIAEALIKKQTEKFKPEEFKDRYTEQLLKVIENKAKGKKPLKKGKKPKIFGDDLAHILTLLEKSLKKEKTSVK